MLLWRLIPYITILCRCLHSTTICHDALTNCDAYGRDVCYAPYDNWARTNCAQYCGMCNANQGGTGQTTKQTRTSTSATAPSTCVDKLSTCHLYDASTCQQYTVWANRECKRFCNLCDLSKTSHKIVTRPSTTNTASNTCADKISNCHQYPAGACQEYSVWAKLNCRNFCNLCAGENSGIFTADHLTTVPQTVTTTTSCVDRESDCHLYGSDVCQQYSGWARINCRNYCNLCSCERAPADIVFLLDSSGSVGYSNFDKQLDFVKKFAETFTIGPSNVQIGVETFASIVYHQFNMFNYTSKIALLNAIGNIPYQSGGTRTDLALRYVMDHSFQRSSGERDNVVNILIVMTDGRSLSKNLTSSVAKELHGTNIKIYVIGIGGSVDKEELVHIASDKNHVFNVSDFNALSSVLGELKKTTCKAQTQPVPFVSLTSATITPPTTSTQKQTYPVTTRMRTAFSRTYHVTQQTTSTPSKTTKDFAFITFAFGKRG